VNSSKSSRFNELLDLLSRFIRYLFTVIFLPMLIFCLCLIIFTKHLMQMISYRDWIFTFKSYFHKKYQETLIFKLKQFKDQLHVNRPAVYRVIRGLKASSSQALSHFSNYFQRDRQTQTIDVIPLERWVGVMTETYRGWQISAVPWRSYWLIQCKSPEGDRHSDWQQYGRSSSALAAARQLVLWHLATGTLSHCLEDWHSTGKVSSQEYEQLTESINNKVHYRRQPS
jgi:hypothetical protein